MRYLNRKMIMRWRSAQREIRHILTSFQPLDEEYDFHLSFRYILEEDWGEKTEQKVSNHEFQVYLFIFTRNEDFIVSKVL